MSEPSLTVRALRPRTQHNTSESQKLHDEAEESEGEEADSGTEHMEEMQLDNNVDEAKESGHEDDANDNSEDDDDYDDDEPRLTIKEEPEDENPDEKIFPPRIYECKTCIPPPEFATLVEYLEHLKDAHQQKSKCQECPYCNFICQHPNRLQRHMMSAHKNVRVSGSINDKGIQNCTMCTYVAVTASDMESHHRLHHMKRRFFRCTKCSYMTHVRARFTKHVKYHSMPMIKCDDCDFRTPYKWNLDRHTRNHGGGGAHQCRVCNFTADIRQSLTVHETNHHEPPLTQLAKRQNPLDRKPRSIIKRYNQVGASDYRDFPDQNSSSAAKTLADQCASSPDASLEDASSAIAGAECIALKCDEKGCQFITAWDSEMQRHLVEYHGPLQSPSKSRKPVPMLIPLSPESKAKSSPVSNGSSPVLQVPRVRVRPELAKIARDTEIAKLYNNRETISVKKEVRVENTFEKRNANFFDKLKERLMTTNASPSSPQAAVSNLDDLKCWCTFEATSPEILAEHKKTHHTALSVSAVGLPRCSKCQTRCKNSSDLQMHMQLCHNTRNNLILNSSNEESTVNMAASQYGEVEYPYQVDWEGNVGGLNSSESSVEGTITTPRRVFKCPHCPFWASTASRFHVHIVGHLNRKPFECSLCAYRSNWRWDITKHIKLKTARDPAHLNARVLMTDETGRRNYSKYNKYLAQMDPHAEEGNHDESAKSEARGESSKKLILMDTKDNSLSATSQIMYNKSPGSTDSPLKLLTPPQVARSQGQSLLKSSNGNSTSTPAVSMYSTGPSTSSEESKRTLWKCKRCNYRDSNKDMVLLHVKSHYDAMENSSESDKNPLACKDCPFIATEASVLALHQIHHRPNLEAIFKCYLCPYYVSTKTELLEHARLHGEELAAVHQQRSVGSDGTQKKSQSLIRPNATNSAPQMDISVEEITPMTSPLLAAAAAKKSDGSSVTPPLLLDTRALPDTPLVWVSRPDGTFSKMLKCRHCPYVSSRRAEVHDHETMHALSSKTSQSIACPDCSFSCNLKEVMNTHTAMHQGALGTVHCLVDENRRDAQQLEDLTSLLGLPKTPTLGPEPDLHDARLVHCCNKCPARFLCEKELQIHLKYHSTDQAYSCEWCSYRARQPVHLLAHEKAHSTEYQNRSRYLLSLYGHSQRFPPPRTTCIEVKNRRDKNGMDVAWIVVTSVTSPSNNFHITPTTTQHRIENQVYTCAKCPARYFKLDALQYHMTLHGSNNRFKCSECDYSSKTAQNLMKHQVVHRRHTETSETPTNRPPPPPPDPQFGNFMRGNPNFVYQGYMRNGRLREKRYKCHKCPSAFEKREQYRVHLTLHGAKQRYRCDTCDYSVKYYANYVQHLKKHHANSEAQASKRKIEILEDSNATIVENEMKEVAKSRRKSTISSGTSLASTVAPNDNASAMSISNQDKQSLLLMQKKGIAASVEENQIKPLRCNDCPFSSTDKETLDIHKRRHGLERLTPPCPHCNYVPRKDENLGDHIRLHFTRICKPESYLVVELLSLTMQRLNAGEKNNKSELLFRDCGDDKFLPVNNASLLANNVLNGSGLQEKVMIDPNTGEATRFAV